LLILEGFPASSTGNGGLKTLASRLGTSGLKVVVVVADSCGQVLKIS
jgi:hypothetical protein